MQGLHYRAIDEHGRVHLGFSLNGNGLELSQQLKQRGLEQLPASRLQSIANLLGFTPRLSQWSHSSAALFTLQLSQLLDAGVPLIQSLEDLARLESQRSIKAALFGLKDRVASGGNLSDAMALNPGLFGADYLACVRAGEASGELSRCLRHQAANIRWQAELSERVKTVLAYPLFALACLIAVLLFVLLYLVPAMLPMLSMSETALPAYTQWLMWLSEFVLNSGIGLLVVLGVSIAALYLFWMAEGPVKRGIQSLLLRGFYGRVLLSFSLARYARSASLLYESGVEFTDAMRISQHLVSNSLLRNQLNTACEQILSGDSIAKAMQSQPNLPPLFVRMVSAGEHAGVMDVALRQCADQLQFSAQYSLDRAERLIGPVLLCIMGGLLLWVVLSVMGPMYSFVGESGAFS